MAGYVSPTLFCTRAEFFFHSWLRLSCERREACVNSDHLPKALAAARYCVTVLVFLFSPSGSLQTVQWTIHSGEIGSPLLLGASAQSLENGVLSVVENHKVGARKNLLEWLGLQVGRDSHVAQTET
jgi:hypothetical protein